MEALGARPSGALSRRPRFYGNVKAKTEAAAR
jgi:hypothetical protein